jgi:histidinol-phosphate/aromatic aminotransferase/cobyric acid decarboxylase-like protein
VGERHGGPIPAELAALGVERGRLVDFSVNLNPYGPAPEMVEAIRQAPLAGYPDPDAGAARQALGSACGVDPGEVVVGPGAADLLWTAVRALLRPGEPVLVVEPAFGELAAAARAAGARLAAWRATSRDGFAVDERAVVEAALGSEARLILLGAPCNPTGRAVWPAQIAALAGALPSAVVIVDESFLALSEDHAAAGAPLPDNVVRVRSLTKEHAIAGVRVGYLLARPPLAARIEAARPPWSTSAAAQAAARLSVQLAGFVAESRARLLADRRALAAELEALGLRPFPSTTNFVLVPVGDAAGLRRRLLAEHAVLVRDCASFDLPDCVRVAARPAADRRRLLTALEAIRAG